MFEDKPVVLLRKHNRVFDDEKSNNLRNSERPRLQFLFHLVSDFLLLEQVSGNDAEEEKESDATIGDKLFSAVLRVIDLKRRDLTRKVEGDEAYGGIIWPRLEKKMNILRVNLL